MYITITDEPSQPIVIGKIEFLPVEPTSREIARAAVKEARRKANRRQIINRIKARFAGNDTK